MYLELERKLPDFWLSCHCEAFFAEAIFLKNKELLRRFAPRNDL